MTYFSLIFVRAVEHSKVYFVEKAPTGDAIRSTEAHNRATIIVAGKIKKDLG